MIEKLKVAGTQCRILSDNELQQFQNLVKPEDVQQKWMEQHEDKGIKNIKETFLKVKKILGNYR